MKRKPAKLSTPSPPTSSDKSRKQKNSVATVLPLWTRERRERGGPFLPNGETWEEIEWLDKVA